MRNGFLKLPWEKVAKYGYTEKLMAWIYANDKPEVTVRELGHLFDISHHVSNSILAGIRGSNKTEQKPNKIEQVPNRPPSNNAGLQGENKQDRTGSEQNRTETEQEGSLSICSKDKEEDKDNNTPFLRFWKAYPKTNGSRAGALKKWKTMKLPFDDGHVDRMVIAVEAQVAFKAHCDLNGDFHPEFPFAEKWLGEERWENVPVIEKEIKITNSERVQADYSRDYLAESNERINRED